VLRQTVRTRPPYQAVELVGSAAEVDRWLVAKRQGRLLVGADRPVPAGGGCWRLRAVLWHQPEPVRIVPQLSPPGRWRAAWRRWEVRDTGRVVWWAVGLGGLAGLGWGLWQALDAAGRWASDHGGQVVALLLLAGVGGVGWAGRKLRGGGRPVCTTTTVHGRRCRGH
jgi:hypothetical protein